jgi:hypothetical protein
MQLGADSVNGDIKMKRTLTAIILCAAAVCASAADKKADKKKAPPAPQVLTIPADAVANPNGTYSYTDKDGKKWVYTKTPFGVTKAPVSDTPESASTPSDLSATKAIDKGDTVRFERPGPFGTMSWEKKKSELTDAERHVLDAQNPKTEQ